MIMTRSSSLLALVEDAQAAGAVVLLSALSLNSLSCADSATDPFDGRVVEAPCARDLKAPKVLDIDFTQLATKFMINANPTNCVAICDPRPQSPQGPGHRADAKPCGAVQPPICRTLSSEGPANRCNAAEQCARGPEAPQRARQSVVSDRKGSLASFAETIQTLKADADAQEPVVELFCRVIDRTVAYNDARIASKQHKPRHDSHAMHPLFEGTKIPLSPSEYVKRILKYTRCSPCNLIVGLVYLQRLKDLDADGKRTRLTSYNIQRLLLTALMLASKFLDEPHCSNKQWALVGDLSVKEMNSLELEMLWLLKFSLNVSREEYDECFQALEALDV